MISRPLLVKPGVPASLYPALGMALRGGCGAAAGCLLALALVFPWAQAEPIAFTATSSLASVASPEAVGSGTQATVTQFIQRFEQLENTYDTALARLYAPEAIIQIHRVNATDNHPSTEIIPGHDYRQRLQQAMPLARTANERQTYHITDIRQETAERVLVIGRRQDVTRGETKPIAWRLEPAANAQAERWQIVQEVAEL